jgi:hypothetical protein
MARIHILRWSLIISFEMVTKKEGIHKNVQQGISSSEKENHHHINTVLSPSQPEMVEQCRSCDLRNLALNKFSHLYTSQLTSIGLQQAKDSERWMKIIGF